MGKRAPAPPDYAGAAAIQAESSRENTEAQTLANRPNQYTPWGSSTWEQGRDGQWSQNINLTPEEQASLESQQRLGLSKSQLAESMTGRMQDEYGNAMDWDQFSEMGGIPEAGQYTPGQVQGELSTEGLQGGGGADDYISRAGDAVSAQFNQRMEPRFEQQREAAEIRLRNQGLRPGDEAYDNAMQRVQQDQDDARMMSDQQAIQMSGSEAARMQGMDLGWRGQEFGERGAMGNFANQATGQELAMQMGAGGQQFGEETAQSNLMTQQRQQQIVEEMNRRGMSLNEINAILHGQQIGMPGMPDFKGATKSDTLQALNAADMQNTANLDEFSANQALTNSLLQGASGAAMAFSDRRLKTDIKPLGWFQNCNWYSYKLFGCIPSIGVMSDEVNPDAVVKHPSGYDMVNYGKL